MGYPDVMASRVDLADAAVTVQQAMIATAELACVYRDVVDQEPELQGSARIMAAWTREVDQTDPNRASTHDFSAPVSPRMCTPTGQSRSPTSSGSHWFRMLTRSWR